MVKITLNPWKLITITFYVLLVVAVLSLSVSFIWASSADRVRTFQIEILEKTGTGTSRNFHAKEIESGKTVDIYPTQEWFNSAKVGDTYNTDLMPSQLNGWIIIWQICSFLCLLVTTGTILFYVIAWFVEKVPKLVSKLDRDMDVYIGESTTGSPISIKKIKIHE